MPEDTLLRRRRCECGAADCTAEILISWEEQDAVDHAENGSLWIVAPKHELRGAAATAVVFRTERYVVVTAREA